MFQARSDDGKIIDPAPDVQDATCPLCGDLVVPKCGRLVIWHFAHKSRENCDPWSEPETEWHRDWKRSVGPLQREVTIRDFHTGIRHRADMLAGDGTVIELQHSPISVTELQSREDFYRNLVWVFDVSEARHNIHIDKYADAYGCHSFRWTHPRRHIAHTDEEESNYVRVILDLGAHLGPRRLFEVAKFDLERDWDGNNGIGWYCSYVDFVTWLNEPYKPAHL